MWGARGAVICGATCGAAKCGGAETWGATGAATAADGVALRGSRCHRKGARRESRGREGCEVDARMPHGTTSHVTHLTQFFKVVQSVSRRKTRRPPTVKNHIDDCLFRTPLGGPRTSAWPRKRPSQIKMRSVAMCLPLRTHAPQHKRGAWGWNDLLDHLVGTGAQRRRHFESERLRGRLIPSVGTTRFCRKPVTRNDEAAH